MTAFDVNIRPFTPEDMPEAIRIVRASWAFAEMESEIGRLSTAAHYLIEALAASNIAYTAERAGETDDSREVIGFLAGHIPGLPLKAPLDSDDARSWADNIERHWQLNTTAAERDSWASDWFEEENETERLARERGLMPESPSRLILFAVSPEAKGRGTGSALYQAFDNAHRGFNAAHAQILHTDTWCNHTFYEKRGFSPLTEVPVFETEASGRSVKIGAFFLCLKPGEKSEK